MGYSFYSPFLLEMQVPIRPKRETIIEWVNRLTDMKMTDGETCIDGEWNTNTSGGWEIDISGR